MNIDSLLDYVIASLLVMTVLYCWKLSRKIALLHASKHELNQFIEDFNQAIERAEHNIVQLKEAGEEADLHLKDHVNKARFLANDLSFLMEKGENTADRLEHLIELSKEHLRPEKAIRTMGWRGKSPTSQMPPSPMPSAPARHNSAKTDTITADIQNGPDKITESNQKPLVQATRAATPPAAPTRSSSPAIAQKIPPQQAASSTPSQMPASKRQALDDVLAQIAQRKAEITKKTPPSTTTSSPASRPNQDTAKTKKKTKGANLLASKTVSSNDRNLVKKHPENA